MNPFRSKSKAAAEAERVREQERQRMQEYERELWRLQDIERRQKIAHQREQEREVAGQKAWLVAAEPQLSSDTTSENLAEHPSIRTLAFGRRKKRVEPRRELNIVDALPPSDNFRTSLLLPKLSARFSVLQCLDESYMDDHQYRKNTPTIEEQHPYFSSFTEDGHVERIIDRAKPRKGNKLFGGRQRVYKTSSATSKRRRSGGLGRAFYEEDVQSSDFFKANHQTDSSTQDDSGSYEQLSDAALGSQEDPEPQTPRSTSTRSDASQMDSRYSVSPGPGFARQSPERVNGKRLYECSLDRHILKHQSSVVGRLESSQPGGGLAPSVLPVSKSASNLNERYFLKSNSTGDTHAGELNQPSSAGLRSNVAEKFTIDPRDLGKATALGAFQRPRTPYNERQFAERQLQLQEGRTTPSPKSSSLAQRFDAELDDCGEDVRQGSFAASAKSSNLAQLMTGFSDWKSAPATTLLGQPGPDCELPSRPSIFEPELHHPQTKATLPQRCTTDNRSSYDPFKSVGTLTTSIGNRVLDREQPSVGGVVSELGAAMQFDADCDLGDMVRKHLRSKSSASSVYPASLPGDEQPPAIPERPRHLASPVCV